MIIAIPAENSAKDSPVSLSFGRSEYLALIDSDTRDCRFIENPGSSSQGGAGIKAAQAVVDNDAQAVLTFRLGQNAADVLQPAGVLLFKAEAGTVMEMVEKYVAGKLMPLTEIHAGHHGGA